MKKVRIAKTIEKWMLRNGFDSDIRIYFNNRCWDYCEGVKTIIIGIKASDYTPFANDNTITMTFEGRLYKALNMHSTYKYINEFNELDFEGYWFDFGNNWNLTFYKLDKEGFAR